MAVNSVAAKGVLPQRAGYLKRSASLRSTLARKRYGAAWSCKPLRRKWPRKCCKPSPTRGIGGALGDARGRFRKLRGRRTMETALAALKAGSACVIDSERKAAQHHDW